MSTQAYGRTRDNDETRVKGIQDLECQVLTNSTPATSRVYVKKHGRWEGPYFVKPECVNLDYAEERQNE